MPKAKGIAAGHSRAGCASRNKEAESETIIPAKNRASDNATAICNASCEYSPDEKRVGKVRTTRFSDIAPPARGKRMAEY